MLKKLMITTAVSALMMGSALAANETDKPGAAPAASSTEMKAPAAPSTSTEMKTPAAPSTTASAPAGKTEAKFVNSQRQDQYLASKFKGTDVVGTDDKKIGDVSDILFDKDGKIEAYVVGVGGFLGIGSKNVALEPSSFTVVKGENNSADKLKLAMTKEELEKAPKFEPYKDPSRTTTGSGGPGSSPAGASRPATSPAPAR